MSMNNKRKCTDERASSSKKMKLVAKPNLDSSIEEEEEECIPDLLEQAIEELKKKCSPSFAQESDSDKEDIHDFIQNSLNEMLLTGAECQNSGISDEEADEPQITIAHPGTTIDEAIVEVGEDDDNDDGGGGEEEKIEEESNSTENEPKYIRNTNRKVFEPAKFETIPIPPWLGIVRPKFVLKFALPSSLLFLNKPLAPKGLPAPAFPAVTTKLIVARRRTPAEREIQEKDIEPAPVTSRSKTKKVYVCEKCNKTLRSKSGFENHQKSHNNDRPFSCAECGKAFTSQACLDKHVKNIYSGKTYSCVHCPKVYKTAHYLRTHMKTHTGEVDFACSHCKKAFIDKQSLEIHMCTHTGERKYVCDVCPEKFVQINHLKTQKEIHLGEKPYECDMCESAFRQKGGLNKHKSRFH